MLIGYARVSTEDQNPEFQVAELTKFGAERVYVDKASGKNLRRPEWKRCRRDLRSGDTLVIWKLDRLARSVLDLHNLLQEFDREGIELVVLTQGIDTRTPAGRLLFSIIGAVAEFERDLISERTKAGVALAKKAGRRMGALPKIEAKHWSAAKELIEKRAAEGLKLPNTKLRDEMKALGCDASVATWNSYRPAIEAGEPYPSDWAERHAQAKANARRGRKN